jgi:hypothetical protein
VPRSWMLNLAWLSLFGVWSSNSNSPVKAEWMMI